jgi:mycoredoxin
MSDEPAPPSPHDAKIVVYGTDWCPDCTRARRVLEENSVAYAWIDVDKETQADAFVRSVNQGKRSVPTIVFPDGSIQVEPTNRALAEKLSLSR